MSNPTPEPPTMLGLTRFAPKPTTPPQHVNLRDVDEAVAYLARSRSLSALTDRLKAVPADLVGQVMAGLADRVPELVRALVFSHAHAQAASEMFTSHTLKVLFADVDDEVLDQAISAGGWLHDNDAVLERLLERLERLERLDDSPHTARRQAHEPARWEHAAATLAAVHDPDRLAAMARSGHVRLIAAINAAEQADQPVHRLVGESVNEATLQVVLGTVFQRDRRPHDCDIDWVAEHADLLDRASTIAIDFYGRWRAPLSERQRLTLLETRHPVLAAQVAEAWTSLGRPGPGEHERDLLRGILTGAGGYVMVNRLLASPVAVGYLGMQWAADWLARTPDINSVAERLLSARNGPQGLPGPIYVAIGERLQERSLTRWLTGGGEHNQRRLAHHLGVDRIAANLNAFRTDAALCVTLPYVPAVIAQAPKPPKWARDLTAGVLGKARLVWEAADEFLTAGFNGSFVDLRSLLFGPQEEGRFRTEPWFEAVQRRLADAPQSRR